MSDIEATILEQLMDKIKHQDDLIHRWTATLVTTQGGLLAGTGVLWNASGIGIHSKGVGTLLLAALGVAVAWACCKAIRSECRWQGQYILYVQKVPGDNTPYRDHVVPTEEDPTDPEKKRRKAKTGGVVVTAVGRVAIVIYILWGLLVLAALAKVAYWSPYVFECVRTCA